MKILRALSLMFLVCAAASAQNAALLPVVRPQFLDNNGVPLVGGYLYTCTAGTTCLPAFVGDPPVNPLATFTDSSGSVANANPIVLDSAGRAGVWLGSGTYKLVLQDANGVTQWSQDNVSSLSLKSVTTSSGAVSNFNVPGTLTVGGTISGKLRDFVSVKDYGATGNGTTDDTAAVQAALNSGSATINFPVGTYKVCDLTLPSFVTLQGARTYNGSVLSCGTTGHSIFTAASTQQVIIDGFAFRGAGVTAIKQTDLTQYFATVTIRNCHFYGELAYGMYGNFIYLILDSSTFGYYGNVSGTFQAIYSKGQYNGNATNFNIIQNSKFFHGAGSGGVIYSEAGYGLMLLRCDFEQNSATPLIIHGMSSIRVANSWFEQNTSAQEMLFANDSSATIGNYVIRVESSNFYPAGPITTLLSMTGSAVVTFDHNDGNLTGGKTVTNFFGIPDAGIAEYSGNHLIGYTGALVNGAQYAQLNVPDTGTYPNVVETLAPTGGAGASVDQVLRGNYSFTGASGTLLSTLAIPSSSKWRIVFEGYWLDNAGGSGLAFSPGYIEVTSDSPTYTLPDGLVLTFSLNGSNQILATPSITADTVFFRGNVHITSSNSTAAAVYSARFKNAVDAPGFTSQGAAGLTLSKTVKGSDGLNCSMTYAGGLLVTTNCP